MTHIEKLSNSRLKISFTLMEKNSITIPIPYNQILQAIIYNNLTDGVANHLHNKGYQHEKRNFKLFTFSKIFANNFHISSNSSLIIKSPFHFFVSFADENITKNLSLNLLKNDTINLRGNTLKVSSIEFLSPPDFKNFVTIKMLSPITVYSTFYKQDGTKKTYFYNPREKEFNEIIKNNALKKYKLILGEEYNGTFEIEPLRFSIKRNFHILKYKGTIIHGYSGIYKLEGQPNMLKILYLCGLGSKNSQGFGMFEIENVEQY